MWQPNTDMNITVAGIYVCYLVLLLLSLRMMLLLPFHVAIHAWVLLLMYYSAVAASATTTRSAVAVAAVML